MEVKNPAIMRQQAETLRTAGLEGQSPVLLRKARGFFQRLSEDRESALCSAYALEYDSEWLHAERAFESLGELEHARRCYWSGFCWSETLRLSEGLSGPLHQEMGGNARNSVESSDSRVTHSKTPFSV